MDDDAARLPEWTGLFWQAGRKNRYILEEFWTAMVTILDARKPVGMDAVRLFRNTLRFMGKRSGHVNPAGGKIRCIMPALFQARQNG